MVRPGCVVRLADVLVTPDLSITLVSTNQLGLIQRYLPSLFALPDRATCEVVLADNACTDGTAEWVEKRYPAVCVVRSRVP